MRRMVESIIDELQDRKRQGDKDLYVANGTIEALAASLSVSDAPAAETAPVAPSASSVATPTAAPAAVPERYKGPAATPDEVAQLLHMDAPKTETPKVNVAKKTNSKLPDNYAPIPTPPVVELPAGSKQEQYDWLKNRILNCETCKAHVHPGKHIVVGSGSLDSPIFYCGEAPGADEETVGQVFVGRAGQLLTKIIGAMGLTRDDVYIGNIMNWRPEMNTVSGNRPPTDEEMAFCLPYLKAQLEIVKPKVIVALGNTAVTGLLGPDPKRRMGDIRGKWTEFAGVPLLPTYHPSYILRNGSMRNKRVIWEDMMTVMEKVGMPISEKQQKFFT